MTEKLYVGHLPPRFEKDDIARLFGIFGKVTNVEIIIDPASGKFKVRLIMYREMYLWNTQMSSSCKKQLLVLWD